MALRHYVLSIRYGETYSLVADGADLVMEGGEVTLDVVPAPPLDAGTITATAGDGTVRIAEGTPPSGGSGSYTRDLYRSTSSGQKGSVLASGVTLPYDDDTAENGTTYYYTLEVDDGSTTDDTPQVSATPEAASEVEPFFSDGFESGDLSHTQNGFVWSTIDPDVVVTSALPRTGTYSMEMRFPGSNAEERFAMGRNVTRLWMEWWVNPADWQHASGIVTNDKFLALWGGPTYNQGGSPIFWLEFRPMNNEGPDSYLNARYNNANSPLSLNLASYQNWITDEGPMERNGWSRMRLHLDVGDVDQSNGIVRVWTDDVLCIDETEVPFAVSDPAIGNYFSHGYLMGSANSDPEDHTWYIDDVKFYDEDPGWED